ncbi:MAG: alpha/beta hydrolase [Proteobacteria bacterium]|jgi:pimeloyl-ACP methyl ester carboxylesterase|nr:alpha/beta hydrolase [Pseudomonadota bacterium]
MLKKTPLGTNFECYGKKGMPVVVLIHGLGLNKEIWEWLIPSLTETYYVIAYDLLGHGSSSDPPKKPSLMLFSDQIRELLDWCDLGKVTLVGFSLGGMICRKFAQEFPKKTNALVILNSPHLRTKAAQEAILKRVNQAYLDGPASTVEDALIRWFTSEYRKKNSDLMDLVRSWVVANDPEVYPSIYQVLADGVMEIINPTPNILCPTLIVTSDEDFGNGPEMAYAMSGEMPNSSVLILNGLRHMALVESPGLVNEPIKSFLDQLVGISKNGH